MGQSRMMRAVALLLVATIVLAASVSADAAQLTQLSRSTPAHVGSEIDRQPGCTRWNFNKPVTGIE